MTLVWSDAGMARTLGLESSTLPLRHCASCKSFATDSNIMLVRCKLVECNCNQRVCCKLAKFKNLSAAAASLVKLLQKKNCLLSDMCAGPVPHNQTCVMYNLSSDHVAIMTGLMV